MAKFEVEVSATAEKQLRSISRDDQIRVVRAMLKLAVDPHPEGCRKLRGLSDTWRIRVGRYRVLYEIHDDRLIIIVLKVGHRRDIYR